MLTVSVLRLLEILTSLVRYRELSTVWRGIVVISRIYNYEPPLLVTRL
jgi:hypothetical protein